MKRKLFANFMEGEFDKVKTLNKTKGKDYSAGVDDHFANFKRQATALGLTEEQVWAVYASKHWDAIMSYCRFGQVESEPIEERLKDVILYCYLLLGHIKEGKSTTVTWAAPVVSERINIVEWSKNEKSD